MSTRTAAALGAAVVVFSGVAAWLGAQAALEPRPTEPEPIAPRGSDDDLRAQIEELERQVLYLEQRVERLERVPEGPAAGESAGSEPPRSAEPPSSGRARPPVRPEDATAVPQPAAEPEPQLSEEELLARRTAKFQEAERQVARRSVPVQLAALADDAPGAAEVRRREAILQARQVGNALAVSQDELDRLQEVYVEHVERLSRDVGPMVKDGLDSADLAGVRTKLEEIWADLDARTKSIVGETKFAAYADLESSRRKSVRDVLAERLAERR